MSKQNKLLPIDIALKALETPSLQQYFQEQKEQSSSVSLIKKTKDGFLIDLSAPIKGGIFGNNYINILGEKLPQLLAVLAKHPEVTELDISNNGIGDVGAEQVAATLKQSNLKTVILTNNNIGPKGAEAIGKALERNTKLEILDLGGNKLGNNGTASIASGLRKNVGLFNISLAENQIGNKGGKAILDSIGNGNDQNKSLQKIFIGSNLFFSSIEREIHDKLDAVKKENKMQAEDFESPEFNKEDFLSIKTPESKDQQKIVLHGSSSGGESDDEVLQPVIHSKPKSATRSPVAAAAKSVEQQNQQ